MEQPVNELERSEIKKDVLEKYDQSICEMQNEKEIYMKKNRIYSTPNRCNGKE